MITELMHTVNGRSHVAQHASPGWLAQLRDGIPQYVLQADGTRVESDRIAITFQCLDCSRILGSSDVTDGQTWEETAPEP